MATLAVFGIGLLLGILVGLLIALWLAENP